MFLHIYTTICAFSAENSEHFMSRDLLYILKYKWFPIFARNGLLNSQLIQIKRTHGMSETLNLNKWIVKQNFVEPTMGDIRKFLQCEGVWYIFNAPELYRVVSFISVVYSVLVNTYCSQIVISFMRNGINKWYCCSQLGVFFIKKD